MILQHLYEYTKSFTQKIAILTLTYNRQDVTILNIIKDMCKEKSRVKFRAR